MFFVLWTGVLVLIFRLHAPFIFPIAFGVADLLIFYITMQLWFGTSDVIVTRSSVRVRSGLLGSGSFHEIPAAEVADIETAIRSQQGGSTGTPYYDIFLVRTDGQKTTLGQTLRDKNEAEWLVLQMRQVIGLQKMAKGASAS